QHRNTKFRLSITARSVTPDATVVPDLRAADP
ncbi:uncharacterized, partial [Tachysurus ichikawai]